LLSYG